MMQEYEPFGQRLRRFFTLMGGIFVISTVVVVTQRLSGETLALLIGLLCGVVVMLPLLLFLAWLWRRQDEAVREKLHTPAAASPPVIVVMPPALPGYGAIQQPALPDVMGAWGSGERKFTIVGGED